MLAPHAHRGAEVGDWPSRRRHIAAFLGLTDPPSAGVVVPDLARYVGSYRDERGRQARLSIHEDVLAVDGLFWRRNRLVPRAPSIFEAESWPFRLTFEADPSGGVARFRLEGPDLPQTRLAEVYEKIDRVARAHNGHRPERAVPDSRVTVEGPVPAEDYPPVRRGRG